MRVLTVVAGVCALGLALACGGGGGGGSAPALGGSAAITPRVAGSDFYVISYQEPAANTPSVSAQLASSVSVDPALYKGQLSSERDLVVAVKALDTASTPEMILALQGGAFSGVVSGSFQAAVYGKAGSEAIHTVLSAHVSVSLDASGIPTYTPNGAPVEFTQQFLPTLPSVALTASSGNITWGEWQGRINDSGDVLLLSRGAAFILMSKEAVHTSAELVSGSMYALMHQKSTNANNNSGTDVSGSAAGVLSVLNESASFQMSAQNVTATAAGLSGDFTRPKIQLAASVSGATSQVVQVLDDNGSVVEQGFMAVRDFYVILNHHSADFPFLMIVQR